MFGNLLESEREEEVVRVGWFTEGPPARGGAGAAIPTAGVLAG